ncbi:MAG: TetR/AcrR family transcriptional regulator [Terriglobia bacterium]|jgi:AcrR family transcriptional regulator
MRTPRSYHHGNLKQALLKASLDLIRKSGAGAFTLREVARRAGVSHNAPYRHFRDKEELLAVLAAEGFDRLTAAMNKAAEPASSALERFRSCGRGYVEFALRYPQHFAVMFEVSCQIELYPQTQAAGERAFGTLVAYVEECQAAGVLPPGDARPFALLAWSMVHGVAKLAISGRLPLSGSADVLRFTDTATAALSRGLGNALG